MNRRNSFICAAITGLLAGQTRYESAEQLAEEAARVADAMEHREQERRKKQHLELLHGKKHDRRG